MPVILTPTSSPDYVGRYTNTTLMEDVAGSYNLSIYSDLEADGTRNNDVIERAVIRGEGQLDSAMRGGQYPIPFTGTISLDVERWATDICVYKTFENRQSGEKSDAINFLRERHDRALKEARLAAFTDLIRLDTTRTNRTPTGMRNIPV